MYYSQWQQDKILWEEIFSKQKSGIFVDIGAHDGITLSNTCFLNEQGWTGLCIEPIESRYKELVQNRPNCIPLNCCVYNYNGYITFTEIEGYSEMLSGITQEYSDEHKARIEYEIIQKGGDLKNLAKKCYTLETICKLYNIDHISYLTIDTEGSEYEILQGMGNIKVDVIDVEENYEADGEKIRKYLEGKGYKYYKKIGGDSVYRLS